MAAGLLFGALAQSVEQLTFNQLVTGSNPVRPTIIPCEFMFSAGGRGNMHG